MQDKKLHDLIRDKLGDYEAPYREEHWDKMSEMLGPGGNGRGGLPNIYRYLGLLIVAVICTIGAYLLVTRSSPPVPHTPEIIKKDGVNEIATSRVASDSSDKAVDVQHVSGAGKSAVNRVFSIADKYTITKMVGQNTGQHRFLPMQYGAASGDEAYLKDIPTKSITKIQLYYTDHPKGTNLDYLNKRRLDRLFNLVPELANNHRIKWEIISQNGTGIEEEAREYFHGFKFYLDVDEPGSGNEAISTLSLKPANRLSIIQPDYKTFLAEHKIRQDIFNKKIREDSTTYKVFERNYYKWKNVVVVCDWTTSMFKYGTQVVSWLSQHEDAGNIQGFVFFNDCDREGKALKDSDGPGQMFAVKSTEIDKVLQAMIAAVRKGGANQDLEENDAEAVKYADEHFPEAEEIVLIADNVSPVRRMNLINSIKKPVKIIVCGSTLVHDRAIQPDYFTIAAKTGGSIHTMEDDLENPGVIKEGTWIRVGNIYYKYKNMAFRPTSKKRRPGRKRGDF